MLSQIDKFLNQITMYRLVLYYLIALLGFASVLIIFHVLSFNIVNFIFSISFLLVVSLVTNYLFSYIYHVDANIESVYITALILGLVITPSAHLNLPFLFWAAVLSQSSKYFLALNKKHIFNPVAVSIFLTAMILNFSASWWVGTAPMLLPVAIGGLLIVRKIRRWDLALSFLVVNLVSTAIYTGIRGYPPLSVIPKAVFDSPLIFFVSVMLTEPLTTPPGRFLRSFYGSVVGLAMVFTTPETALIIGNLFSYFLSPHSKRVLTLKERNQLSPDTFDFIFTPDRPLVYAPGQYLEWTVPPKDSDSRGNRRYFTLASSPTETNIHVGVKFADPSSTFKETLLSLTPGQTISAGQLAGDFTLPANRHQKLAFIAGGIGITPFRSMVKYLVDRNETRPITLFYQAKSEDEFVYRDVFTAAEKIHIHTLYSVMRLSPGLITRELPDYLERVFYLSGPQTMVNSYKQLLLDLHIPRYRIKTDYFPGF